MPHLYITEFCQRLVELARLRVRSGDVSERGLARKAGISQPHMHNVLKGIRTLSPVAADRLMRALNVTVPQVVWSGGGLDATAVSAVPVLRSRVGPGTEASFDSFRGFLPFPIGLVGGIEPLAAYLSADLALPSEYRNGDLVLLDVNREKRLALSESAESAGQSCWVVAAGGGLRVRYVRRTRGGLEIASEPGVAGSRDWQPISLHGKSIPDIVRARIVWIGREMETSQPGSYGPSRAGD
jgi:hypothetical protein